MVRDSKSGHQLLLPSADWCPMIAVWTTQEVALGFAALPAAVTALVVCGSKNARAASLPRTPPAAGSLFQCGVRGGVSRLTAACRGVV